MSSYRVSIEYRTRDGQRRRVVYEADMNGLRWSRRESVYVDGQWCHQSQEYVSSPSVKIYPVGGATFAGP